LGKILQPLLARLQTRWLSDQFSSCLAGRTALKLLFFLGFFLSRKPEEAIVAYPVFQIVGPAPTIVAFFPYIVWDGAIKKQITQMSFFFFHLFSPFPFTLGAGFFDICL